MGDPNTTRIFSSNEDFAKWTDRKEYGARVREIIKIVRDDIPKERGNEAQLPVLLYDRRIEHEPPTGAPVDPTTSTLPVPTGFWPYLGWVGWNDRARSVRIFGVNVLCENPWFGGRWGWLIGFNGLLNLGNIAFDRVASSPICG